MPSEWIEKQFNELKKLALAEDRFGQLSEAEIRMLRAAIAGGRAWCGPSQNDDDPLNDPSSPQEWGKEREIRADLVRWLCVDKGAEAYVDPGGIVVHGAQISSALDLSYASVRFPLGFLRCRFHGEIFLISAGLPALALSGSAVPGVTADGAKFQYSVFLNDGFSATGRVSLLGAQIGRNLACDRGTFKNPSQKVNEKSGTALHAERISVTGNVFLRNGFVAEGLVRLLGAQVSGDLECDHATFQSVIMERASITGLLFWWNINSPQESELNLGDASAGALVDDQESWPDPDKGKLHLDGFVYGRIAAGPKDSKTRLDWLARQESFSPQPYRQLAKVLREEGDDDGARRVLYEMEKLKHKDGKHGWAARFWNPVFRWTIGYGIYPRRAVWGLLLLVALGWAAYGYGYFAGAISPTNGDAYKELRDNNRLLPHYQRFNALVYSAENSFPLVSLGQRESWQSDPNQQGLAGFLRVFRWMQVLLGWVLATFFVAGVTGIARKD